MCQVFTWWWGCRNVPYNWINEIKANQRWMQKEGEKFFFPGGGTMFPNGVDEYLNQMEELLPEMKDGTIRTALDTGCGVRFFFFSEASKRNFGFIPTVFI